MSNKAKRTSIRKSSPLSLVQTVYMQTPPQQLLQEALRLARRRGRSVFVYRNHQGWAIAEKLAEIPASFEMIEVPPDREHAETQNRGGC